MNSDVIYMQLALDEAWKYQGLTYPNPAVGASVVCDSRLLSVAAHQKAGTSHAEVLALLGAYEKLTGLSIDFDPLNAHKAHTFLRSLPQDLFANCTVYVTLEPCSHHGKTPSCAELLTALKPKRVVIAALDPIEGHDGGAERLRAIGIDVEVGLLQEKAEALIEPFLIWRKRAFVLFKLAQTTNGRIGGGYLSSPDSLAHVHQLRSVLDKLVIGGNTVRVDRPTLDCRFADGGAPDVVIYSQADDFDQEIPLFAVENRMVDITDNLDFLEHPSFVMVEGGEGMLNALKEKIDWLLIYQTPRLSTNNLAYNVEMDLEFVHHATQGKDIMIWSRQGDR